MPGGAAKTFLKRLTTGSIFTMLIIYRIPEFLTLLCFSISGDIFSLCLIWFHSCNTATRFCEGGNNMWFLYKKKKKTHH